MITDLVVGVVKGQNLDYVVFEWSLSDFNDRKSYVVHVRIFFFVYRISKKGCINQS